MPNRSEGPATPPAHPTLAGLVADHGCLYGGWLQHPWPEAIDSYRAAGFHYVGVDCQHSGMTVAAAVQLLDPLKYIRFPAVVRVSHNDLAMIGQSLDAGASGVIVPMVETAEEAARAVQAAQYAPLGGRSFGTIRSDLMGLTPQDIQNRGTVLVMIETERALDNVQEIAAVPGLGGLYVGPADLSVSLGMAPWEGFTTNQLVEPFSIMGAAAEANGILFGAAAIDAGSAGRWRDLGCNFVSVGTAAMHLRGAIAAAAADLQLTT